ncbi:ABC transporter permease [Algoriphagus resistens]|uniref:ABC transporter permease n=1 Tax=Algoriphagus resistens TaxID=1750590 RepID=UPI000716C16E|nr:FtsX-like permease family protein [Algoriphagus resistens]
MEFEWVDDMVKSQYEKEQAQAHLFTFFSVLMLFLAALGIFGLVVHATEQRVKEIGVRKVLGASAGSIVQLFSLDYIKLVVIALMIASPIAWYGMNLWLSGFAYKISLQWWMFVGAGLLAAILALSTVGVRVLWTARINPVNSLRSE